MFQHFLFSIRLVHTLPLLLYLFIYLSSSYSSSTTKQAASIELPERRSLFIIRYYSDSHHWFRSSFLIAIECSAIAYKGESCWIIASTLDTRSKNGTTCTLTEITPRGLCIISIFIEINFLSRIFILRWRDSLNILRLKKT